MTNFDMTQFVAAKSDQLNADDLLGGPMTITVTKVTAQPDATEQPVSIHYEGGEGRPFKPCKTMRRLIMAVWGKYTSEYVGKSMTLYRDPEVSFGGMKTGGIRISHMSHMDGDKTVALLVTRGRKAPFKIQPLKASETSAQANTIDNTKPRQTAEEWANDYVGKVKACENLDDLIALQTRSASALAKLEKDKPDLHELAVNAGTQRAKELQPEDAF